MDRVQLSHYHSTIWGIIKYKMDPPWPIYISPSTPQRWSNFSSSFLWPRHESCSTRPSSRFHTIWMPSSNIWSKVKFSRPNVIYPIALVSSCMVRRTSKMINGSKTRANRTICSICPQLISVSSLLMMPYCSYRLCQFNKVHGPLDDSVENILDGSDYRWVTRFSGLSPTNHMMRLPKIVSTSYRFMRIKTQVSSSGRAWK